PTVEDRAADRMELSALERVRIDVRRRVDVLLGLRSRLRRAVARARLEVREDIPASIGVALPHERAHERADIDLDAGLFTRLARRRLLERLAGLVVPRRSFPVRPVRTALQDHEQASVLDDQRAHADERRPAHATFLPGFSKFFGSNARLTAACSSEPFAPS